MDVLNFNKVLLSNDVNLESLRRENLPDARTIDSRLKAHCKLYCKVFQIYQLSKLFNLSSTFKDEVFKPVKWLPATLLFKRSGKFDHLNSEQESLGLLPEWVQNNYKILSASYKIEKISPQLIHILEETFHYFYKELSGKDFPKINKIESSIESDFSKPLIFLSFDKSWKFLACELSNEINKVIEIDESLNKNIILEKIESKKHLTNFLYNSWTK